MQQRGTDRCVAAAMLRAGAVSVQRGHMCAWIALVLRETVQRIVGIQFHQQAIALGFREDRRRTDRRFDGVAADDCPACAR